MIISIVMPKGINFYTVIVGIAVSLACLLIDVLFLSTPGVGYLQLAGFTIGALITCFGLRRIFFPLKPRWDWLLFVIYLIGVYFAGLSSSNQPLTDNAFLSYTKLGYQDLAINVLGFIPLAYILYGTLLNFRTTTQAVILCISVCFFTSLSIEYFQYCCLTGRYSSIYDLLANSVGALIGVIGLTYLNKKFL